MPRYFFHIYDGQDVPDLEGVELDDPQQARLEAVVAAGSILREKMQFRWDAKPWTLHVVDQDDRTVCRLSLFGSLS